MKALSHASKRAVIAFSLAAGIPTMAAAQPYAYVANLGSDDVSVIDVRTRSVVTTLPAGDDPDGTAVSPDGRSVYVTSFLSDSVTVIDTGTNTVSATLAVGKGPVGAAVSPDGSRLYVANRGADSVSVLDTANGSVVAEVSVGRGPNSVAFTPDGAKVYVTNSSSHNPGSVSVIDATTLGLQADVAVQRSPSRAAISPDGRTLYVTNFRSWNVSVIDVATDQVETTIRVFGSPSGVAVNPNGAYAYVTTLEARLEIIDATTNQVVSGLPIGGRAFGVAVSRNGGQGFVANFGDGTVTALDLAEETVLGDIAVGARPFAVSVNCVGAACDELPWTPKPTRTRTVTPTRTKTLPRPTSTPTRTRATATPTRTPRASLEIAGGNAAPGTTGSFSVRLRTGGLQVIAAAIDLVLAAPLSVARKENGRPDCTVNPEIDKPSTAFAFVSSDCPPGVSCTAVRVGVISFVGEATPIADGSTLFSCRVDIDRGARPGAYSIGGVRASVVLPSAAEEAARVRPATIEVGEGRSALRQVAATKLFHFCEAGPEKGQPCSDHADCSLGLCVVSVSVCDGGDDHGLLCQCAGGQCRREDGNSTCGDGAGRCAGGEHPDACCEVELNCAGGNACVSTELICAGGPSKGSPCLRDDHCPASSCSPVSSFCAGGDFAGFPCIDHRDCSRGECFDPDDIVFTPGAQQATPTPQISSRSTGDDSCSIAASEGGRSAWFLALPVWLWARRRSRAQTL